MSLLSRLVSGNPDPPEGQHATRQVIAILVLKRVFRLLFILAGATLLVVWLNVLFSCIYSTDCKDSRGLASEMTRYVFAALVPIAGAWVGAVIAYYFGTENYETAARQSRQAMREAAGTAGGRRNAPPSAKDIMLTRRSLHVYQSASTDLSKVTLATLLEQFDQTLPENPDKRVTRLPILLPDRSLLCILRKEHIKEFQETLTGGAPVTSDASSKTLEDLKKNAGIWKKVMDYFIIVGLDDPVDDVRRRLKDKPSADNAVVTDTGKDTGVFLGLITNDDLART